MTKEKLDELLGKLPGLTIGVIGDFCLDAYWTLDTSYKESSVETGLPIRPVRKQRYSLGGAGNVVANLVAMSVGKVKPFGVVGKDPFGGEMSLLLHEFGNRTDISNLIVQSKHWETPVYIKPIADDKEGNRTDFGVFNRLSDETATDLIRRFKSELPALDAVIVNQQLPHGIHTERLRRELNALMSKHREKLFIVDSRHFCNAYEACIHKTNDVEAARLCGLERKFGDVIAQQEATDCVKKLYARWKRPVVVTRGGRGCLVADRSGISVVSGLHIVKRTDTVGAGDSMLAGLTAALAAGATPQDAAEFGNFVAGVAVQKLFQTGTASPAEIREIGEDPDYVYSPELADDARNAKHVKGTNIEIVVPLPARLKITHAIFDHDGTLSSLRQGWEKIMEPVMIKAVMGDRYKDANETTYARVLSRVRDYVDKTTGVQTLVQMRGLVEIVEEFNMVPKNRILDAFGYKKIYNDALMEVVRERVARLKSGDLDITDYTIKKAPLLLERLHKAGVKLYLASGTDEADVTREVEALGYARFFHGRIYGAVGDINKEAKKMVLERILNDIGRANVHQLVTFGDGPVEIRETRKRGALTVGVASDEVQRFGMNMSKRSRLIRAGAHLIVPDYSQLDKLLGVLRAK